MTSRRIRCYDLSGVCCRMGVWWTEPGWQITLGDRAFVYARTVRGWAIYEEVWG